MVSKTMNCPRCEAKMETIKNNEVELDVCRSCGGMWLDKGELEKLVKYGKDKFK